jgi:hypothetical protein
MDSGCEALVRRLQTRDDQVEMSNAPGPVECWGYMSAIQDVFCDLIQQW